MTLTQDTQERGSEMANIDPQGDAMREIVQQIRDRGIAPENCIIRSVRLDNSFFRMIAIDKKDGIAVARSWEFRPTITGSFL
ncbi:hypothetical protein HYV71_04515 [Candidatus Uhrbacteria bacterium]|nr:hypothetical protein [Candidatus Uhrbacteria bacterium]